MRKFTLEQARSTLPLVKQIAADIQAAVAEVNNVPGGWGVLKGVSSLDDVPLPHRKAVTSFSDKVQSLINELSEIGAESKGFDPVLVDYLSERDGEDIYLCWQSGEEDITHWHTLEGGFKARQPL
jgi:hypothetical protein